MSANQLLKGEQRVEVPNIETTPKFLEAVPQISQAEQRLSLAESKTEYTKKLLNDTLPAVFSTKDGAIGGYDVVAYFNDTLPVKGREDLSTTWQGALWKFSTAENRAAFLADPEKFRPQYGGYCAFGMSNNYKAPTSPDAWSLIDGKLYLNYNKKVQQQWKTEVAKRIPQADLNWKKFQ